MHIYLPHQARDKRLAWKASGKEGNVGNSKFGNPGAANKSGISLPDELIASSLKHCPMIPRSQEHRTGVKTGTFARK